VLAAAATLEGPFAVANADDAYGRDALVALRRAIDAAGGPVGEAVLVTYPAGRVLSAAGGVSRGWVRRMLRHEAMDDRRDVGSVPADEVAARAGVRTTGPYEVIEVHHLRHRMGCAMLEGSTEGGAPVAFPPDTPVSMNLWGLTPRAVEALREGWADFARTLVGHPAGPLAAEFGLSTSLTALARAGRVRIRPVEGGTRWFGMTYPDDHPGVVAQLEALHADGTYPPTLAGPGSPADSSSTETAS
jgi:hypothetical protein